jgi:hypothetical protein
MDLVHRSAADVSAADAANSVPFEWVEKLLA